MHSASKRHPGWRSLSVDEGQQAKMTSIQLGSRPASRAGLEIDTGKKLGFKARSRSNTAASSYLPFDSNLSPTSSIDSAASKRNNRGSKSGSTHSRADYPESRTKSLVAKGSRLFRRQNSKSDLTSLTTLNWLDGSDGSSDDFTRWSSRPGRSRNGSGTSTPYGMFNVMLC